MNPLGFALENFDAVGRFRDQENGKPIDATGSYETRAGTTAKFAGARNWPSSSPTSHEVHAAFVEQLFHHLVKQPVRAYGLRPARRIAEIVRRNGFNMRKLVVEIAVTALQPTKN